MLKKPPIFFHPFYAALLPGVFGLVAGFGVTIGIAMISMERVDAAYGEMATLDFGFFTIGVSFVSGGAVVNPPGIAAAVAFVLGTLLAFQWKRTLPRHHDFLVEYAALPWAGKLKLGKIWSFLKAEWLMVVMYIAYLSFGPSYYLGGPDAAWICAAAILAFYGALVFTYFERHRIYNDAVSKWHGELDGAEPLESHLRFSPMDRVIASVVVLLLVLALGMFALGVFRTASASHGIDGAPRSMDGDQR